MTEPHLDRSLGFVLPARHARGRVVRLGPVLQRIVAAHAYPPVIAALLAEALVLTTLLGATLKDDGAQMTLQAQTESGPVELLVCDYRGGELRGYIKFDADRLAEMPADPSLYALFGKGYLAITFDQAATGERYQGIVPLEGATLADAAETYFAQSEQLPSLIRVAVGEGRAAGILTQYLPEGEEGRERLHVRVDRPEWEHVATLAGTVTDAELLDAALSPETLIWRLFSEEDEVRVVGAAELTRGCRCDRAHITDVLSRFTAGERVDMADDRGVIAVDCAFCSRVFDIATAELEATVH
jgi:molecular chaperone Hsp33